MAFRPTPSECPVCGESVPRGARACLHCGADERSGWNEAETIYDGIDLPDHGPREQLSRGAGRKSSLRTILWSATAAVLILALLFLFLR
jgi:hypothetical protein